MLVYNLTPAYYVCNDWDKMNSSLPSYAYELRYTLYIFWNFSIWTPWASSILEFTFL